MSDERNLIRIRTCINNIIVVRTEFNYYESGSSWTTEAIALSRSEREAVYKLPRFSNDYLFDAAKSHLQLCKAALLITRKSGDSNV